MITIENTEVQFRFRLIDFVTQRIRPTRNAVLIDARLLRLRTGNSGIGLKQ